ncbi:BTAD domain-containing putative transcriptional regulator [Streptomyces sp. NPDC001691]|uniref:AfsR/SARP family transcriptional regulator n=1 Tax=unclassified Streptomyces TaxID=2593676 RepID=UPI001CB9138E|nr:AfsR/SARP family transcriptional regulator [Streptomyces sp. SDr-06]
MEVQDERSGLRILPTGAKQRALLAALVVRAGHEVSARRLIQELWGGHPPANAANALQIHVARLRRLLVGPVGQGTDEDTRQPWIVTTPHGYTLRLDPAETDAARFRQLAEKGRLALSHDPGEAGELLDQALALWRGPALQGSVLGDICADEAARLDELRLTALEMRCDAYLRAGRHGEVAGELAELTSQHPTRERFHHLLMVALYRCGRQAEALAVYERARHHIRQELGVEPGPALRDLMVRILHHDPALSGAAGSRPTAGAQPREAPARVAGPVRPLGEELAQLHRRIEHLQHEQEQLLRRFYELTGAPGGG